MCWQATNWLMPVFWQYGTFPRWLIAPPEGGIFNHLWYIPYRQKKQALDQDGLNGESKMQHPQYFQTSTALGNMESHIHALLEDALQGLAEHHTCISTMIVIHPHTHRLTYLAQKCIALM